MFFFLKEIASILYQKLANQHIITFSNRKVWSFSCFLSPGSRFSFQHSALQIQHKKGSVYILIFSSLNWK